MPPATVNAYSYQSNSQIGGSAGSTPMMGPVSRDSWDYVPYNETNAGSVNPVMQGMFYPRNDGNEEASSTGYQMTHTSSGP